MGCPEVVREFYGALRRRREEGNTSFRKDEFLRVLTLNCGIFDQGPRELVLPRGKKPCAITERPFPGSQNASVTVEETFPGSENFTASARHPFSEAKIGSARPRQQKLSLERRPTACSTHFPCAGKVPQRGGDVFRKKKCLRALADEFSLSRNASARWRRLFLAGKTLPRARGAVFWEGKSYRALAGELCERFFWTRVMEGRFSELRKSSPPGRGKVGRG